MVGIGFLGTGFFATDPLNGYPPRNALPCSSTDSYRVSSLISLHRLSLVCPLACLVMARLFDDQGERNWAIYSRLQLIAFIIVYLAARWQGFSRMPGLVNYAGLLQRISSHRSGLDMDDTPSHLPC